MTKPAEMLRAWDAEIRFDVEGSSHTDTRTVLGDAAALLDECERVLGALVGDNPNALSYAPARATLAKLRGEQ